MEGLIIFYVWFSITSIVTVVVMKKECTRLLTTVSQIDVLDVVESVFKVSLYSALWPLILFVEILLFILEIPLMFIFKSFDRKLPEDRDIALSLVVFISVCYICFEFYKRSLA